MNQHRLNNLILAAVFLVSWGHASTASAQASPPAATRSAAAPQSVQDQLLTQLTTEFDTDRKSRPGSEKEFMTSVLTYIPYLVAPATTQKLFHAFEEQRIDMQVTTSQSSGSSTSTTNRGSVPWLFGLALENGAVTQSVENSQIVLRGNIANAISALKYKDYVISFDKLQEQNDIIRNIAKTSFAITFAPSQTTNSAASPINQTNDFSGFSIHYDIWNHRDPRDKRWRTQFVDMVIPKLIDASKRASWGFQPILMRLLPLQSVGIAGSDDSDIGRIIRAECGLAKPVYQKGEGVTITGSANQTCSLSDFKSSDGRTIAEATATIELTGENMISAGAPLKIIDKGSGATSAPVTATLSNGTAICSGTAVVSVALETGCSQWTELAQEKYKALGPTSSDEEIKAALKTLGDNLVERVKNSPELMASAQNVADSLVQAGQAKTALYNKIMNSPTVSFEYTYARQATNQIPGSTATTSVSAASPIPNLSTFNLISNVAFLGGSQLSLNGVATIFNSLPPGSRGGSMRDVEVTGQLDIPLPQIAQSVGKPTLTFSGLYMDLINQPLGQPLLVNGVPESRTGNIGLFQSKFTIPAGKGTGVQIPLSFTYANRTELIKESDVRGSIGITFNLDSIFSKPQSQ